MNDCAILILSSPIAAHPSTDTIENTLRRLVAYPDLAKLPIVIGLDGVRAEQEHKRADYNEYIQRLKRLCAFNAEFGNVSLERYSEWQHQSGMLFDLLPRVHTELVFFVEADTFPMGDIPFGDLFRAFNDSDVQYLRLSIFSEILECHKYLYDPVPVEIEGVPLVKTWQLSARPSIMRTRWFEDLLRKHIPVGSKVFWEDYCWGYFQALGKPCGLYQYNPPGNILRSGTVDGRGDDPKYPQFFEGKWYNS